MSKLKRLCLSHIDGTSNFDRLSFMLYQKFCNVIKKDFIEMFEDFHKEDLDLYRLNFALITVRCKNNEQV
jgi:hypothetical protein